MASVCRDDNGLKRVQFSDLAGERRTIRLGKVRAKSAETFARRVEELLEDLRLGNPHAQDLTEWVSELDATYYDRLAAVGLVKPREHTRATTLGGLFEAFFGGVSVKPATLIRMRQAESALLEVFGKGREVATIGETDAEDWRTHLRERGYAQATISRTVLYARQIFRWAVRRKLAPSNPFADLKAGSQANPSRAMFIDRATIAKVIDAAPDAEWRLLIALSRFGGLRIPSEGLGLRWTDVDWENSRLTVRSPKTEHHEGHGERMIPLFPEVREHLQMVFEQAPDGAEFVISRYRTGCNLNPQLRRIIQRAGLTPWEKTWHNLRASRQTELAASYPLHTVCSWIGNTKAIAAGHYLQVTDADWKRATEASLGTPGGAKSGALVAQKAAQRVATSKLTEPRESLQSSADTTLASPDASWRGLAKQSEWALPDLNREHPHFQCGALPLS